MKEKKEKKDYLKFKELPKELFNYFLLRFIFCGLIIIGILLFAIFSKLWQVALFIAAVSLIYIGNVLINFLSVIKKKVKVYYGFFVKKEERELDLGKKGKSVLSLRGPCSMLLTPVEDSDSKYIVPIGNTFTAETGSIITVYSNPSDIYQRNNNTFYFQNPLLVTVSKM